MTTPAAPPLRIAVADDDPTVREFLEKFVPRLGHAIASVSRTGRELVEHCRRSAPDLIIADLKMPEMTGLEAVAAVNQQTAVPAILLTGHADPASVEAARATGVMAYLVKPITEDDLAPAIAIARRQFEQTQGLRKEAADLRQALEDRKLIERAKGAVGRRCGVGEDEAYRRLRRLATDGGRKLADVAQQVLAAEETFRTLDGMG